MLWAHSINEPFLYIRLSPSALYYVTDGTPGSLRDQRHRHQHHLVQELHREATADLPHGISSACLFVCFVVPFKLFVHVFYCFSQHHVIIQQYVGTLENLLFTAELDHHILAVYQQFCALQLWAPTMHHCGSYTVSRLAASTRNFEDYFFLLIVVYWMMSTFFRACNMYV